MLKKIAASTTLAVSVERAKERLNIDANDFDNDLEALILAATAALETQAGITLQQSSWEYRSDVWSHQRFHAPIWWNLERGFYMPFPHIDIPSAPVRDVTAVKYLDENDAEQTIDPSNYTWERTPSGAAVTFVQGYTVPVISNMPQAVRVSFDAGYDDPSASGSGDDPELKIPPQAEMAILFLVGHWHRTGESVSDGQTYTVPQTFDYLAAQLRVYR